MAYVALYRRWRPSTFADLAGQRHVSQTLTKAIETNKISHAYLFAGPRGTGKTSVAKIFAKALNCQEGPTPAPCGKCDNCRKITEGSSMDVFEIDAASNRGIDEIRDLRETVKFAPAEGRYKVYIIDEVHMLTTEAFNALLKTLEEPPSHVVFILATTEAHKVPVTIQSRTQRYDFKRILPEEIVARLKYVAEQTGIEITDDALFVIARAADGGLRDALSILDQAWSLTGGAIDADKVREILGLTDKKDIYDVIQAIAEKNAAAVVKILGAAVTDGKDLKQLTAELTAHFRNLMIFKAAGDAEGIDYQGTPVDVLAKQANLFPHEKIIAHINRLYDAARELKFSPQPRITLEAALLSMCFDAQPTRAATGEKIMGADEQKIAKLEAKVAALSAQLAAGTVAAQPIRPAADKAATAATAKPAAKKENMPTGDNITPAAENAAPKNINVNADDEELWKKFLAELDIRRKVPLLACFKHGRFVGRNDNRLQIEFPTDMYMSMAEEKYHAAAEKLLTEVVGEPTEFFFSSRENARGRASAPKIAEPKAAPKFEPKPTPPKKSAKTDEKFPVDMTDLDDDERENMKHAIDVFGDNVVPMD